MNYYNEFDPHAAAWLRELINQGHVPQGEVDTRSITDVTPNDLKSFNQCHFFAGIGGWSHALQLAGWPEDRPVWTGSCPCQPFSVAGKGRGTADERHLWPVFANLIREFRPPIVFGEQVASRAGRGWLAGVFADLEGMGYAVAGADLCAAGAGAPHIRQRLYWVANADRGRCEQRDASIGSISVAATHGTTGRLGDSNSGGLSERLQSDGNTPQNSTDRDSCGPDAGRPSTIGGLEYAQQQGLEGHAGHGDDGHQPGRQRQDAPRPTSAAGNAWDSFDLLPCLDGKTRRIEPGSFPLAHGVPGRVGLLRGYGNAIVPQIAAAFIKAAIE